jgi:hypothetical protein
MEMTLNGTGLARRLLRHRFGQQHIMNQIEFVDYLPDPSRNEGTHMKPTQYCDRGNHKFRIEFCQACVTIEPGPPMYTYFLFIGVLT